LYLRDQIVNFRLDRALRTLKNLQEFQEVLLNFLFEEARKEANNILEDKDPPSSLFDLKTLRNFSYMDQLAKLQYNFPLLVACISGSLAKSRDDTVTELCRKGFGGKNRDEEVELVPMVVQTVTRITRNRHPLSLSTVTSMNSLFLWTSRVSSHVFQLFNSMGDCYRYGKQSETEDCAKSSS